MTQNRKIRFSTAPVAYLFYANTHCPNEKDFIGTTFTKIGVYTYFVAPEPEGYYSEQKGIGNNKNNAIWGHRIDRLVVYEPSQWSRAGEVGDLGRRARSCALLRPGAMVAWGLGPATQ